jgi:diadenylate cyclase
MILDLFQEVWRPLVEILIIGVAIYYPLKFVRGTRGWPVVLGFMAMVFVVYVGARLSNFAVISWIMDRFLLTGFALAALVIFQPELRRILAELGNMPFLHSAHEERENIEVIVQTAERLGEMRIGALLALERSIQLEEAVESGVVVDCQATPEMLETIFFPNNAIHDGGIIIRGDRITKAACIFPLTQRQDLSKSLGTRHRAAIGLTEETDAVVVIVSEETGAISYAFRGNLVRSVSLEELRAFLTTVFVHGAKPERVFPEPDARAPEPARAVSEAATRAQPVSKPAMRPP